MSVGVLTDLDQTEARERYQGTPVTSDDVITAHRFLEQYQGDVNLLVNNRYARISTECDGTRKNRNKSA
ncbi:MAG: hypothetical protein WDN67_00225 [Candidatus Moraniibacteriota bacterium]